MRLAYERGGTEGFWRQRLSATLQEAHPSPFVVATIYAQLGDRDRTLDWLERAYAQRDRFVIFVGSQWQLAPLAADARFEQLVRRLGI